MFCRILKGMINTGILMSLSSLITLVGCEEPKSCESDADCREGYRCDLKVYVGECVEVVRVVRCGDQLCQAPEVCIRDEVCVVVERNDMNPGGMSGGGVEPPIGGSIGGSTSGVMSGAQGGDSGGVQGGMSGGTTGGVNGGDPSGEPGGVPGGALSGQTAGSALGGMSGVEALDMEVIDMFEDPFDRDQGGAPCESACDCTPGLSCVAGACTSGDSPVYCCDGFCPAGESCETPSGVRDICLDARCETACDCRSGLSCISGVCELGSEPIFCCDSGSCPSGMACDTVRGVRSMCPSEACTTACDCSAGQRCVDGVCTLQGDPLFCCESSTCPPGGICQSSTGMASTCDASSSCESACDCTPGMACEGGSCQLLDSPVFCCDSASCPVGERCQPEAGGPLSLCE